MGGWILTSIIYIEIPGLDLGSQTVSPHASPQNSNMCSPNYVRCLHHCQMVSGTNVTWKWWEYFGGWRTCITSRLCQLCPEQCPTPPGSCPNSSFLGGILGSVVQFRFGLRVSWFTALKLNQPFWLVPIPNSSYCRNNPLIFSICIFPVAIAFLV